MAATSHGDQQAVCSGEADGLLHVGDPGAAYDEGRPPVDIPVPHTSRGLVASMIAPDHLAAHRTPEAIDVRVAEGAGGPIRRYYCDRRHVEYLQVIQVVC
jgi:hypothetical protein